jgi:hypothetical protein
MSPEAMRELFDPAHISSVEACCFGRPHLWSVGLSGVMPGFAAQMLHRVAGAVGSLVPISIPRLAPYVVAVAVKR